MVSINSAAHELTCLGARLRAARIARDEPMRLFAQRIGVSIPTLRAMEQGVGTVQVKHWANALWALDRLPDIAAVLAQSESPLDLARRQSLPHRQRASRRAT